MSNDYLEDQLPSEEMAERVERVAMKSPDHLKRWLEATGLRWLVLNTAELVDALSFPAGVDTLMQIIACYRDHRRAIPTGSQIIADPISGKPIEVAKFKDENLEKEELDRAIRYLVGQITEIDPNWNLNTTPL
jgi:hypothetical protein